MGLRGLLLFFLLLACPAVLRAGTAVRLGVGDLVQRSDLCLEGRVIAARAVLEPRGRRIDTEYTLQVAKTFWGDPQAVRVIKIPGGVLPDGRGMAVPGLPQLEVGEEAILFLSAAGSDDLRLPIGLAQGRMRVSFDRSGRKLLVRVQEDLRVVGPGAPPPAVLDYSGTVLEIEAAAARRRGRR